MSISGLPPSTILLAQIDPLRSEGENLPKRMRTAGTSEQRFDGVTHVLFGMATAVDKAKEAQAVGGAQLRKAFEGRPPPARGPWRRARLRRYCLWRHPEFRNRL